MTSTRIDQVFVSARYLRRVPSCASRHSRVPVNFGHSAIRLILGEPLAQRLSVPTADNPCAPLSGRTRLVAALSHFLRKRPDEGPPGHPRGPTAM